MVMAMTEKIKAGKKTGMPRWWVAVSYGRECVQVVFSIKTSLSEERLLGSGGVRHVEELPRQREHQKKRSRGRVISGVFGANTVGAMLRKKIRSEG
jgi:hypothetical protein